MPDPAHEPVTHDFVLIATMYNMETFRIEVTATDWQAACRAVIHAQMAEGMSVRSIRGEDWE
jgi:hypothetical protein